MLVEHPRVVTALELAAGKVKVFSSVDLLGSVVVLRTVNGPLIVGV